MILNYFVPEIQQTIRFNMDKFFNWLVFILKLLKYLLQITLY